MTTTPYYDPLNLHFYDMIEFLTQKPNSTITVGNVTFNHDANGERWHDKPTNQWHIPTISQDLTNRLKPQWNQFTHWLKTRQANSIPMLLGHYSPLGDFICVWCLSKRHAIGQTFKTTSDAWSDDGKTHICVDCKENL